DQRTLREDLLLLARGSDRGRELLFLIRQNHARQPQTLALAGQVRNREIRFERAHLASLVFADQELEHEVAGRKRQSRVVVKVALGKLRRGLLRELHRNRVADTANRLSARVLDLADEVDLSAFAALFLCERDRRAGDLRRERNEVAVLGDSEVVDLQ